MSSRIVKFGVCDRCGMEEQAEAATTMPPGWWQLTRQGYGKTLDLCSTCGQVLMEFKRTEVEVT